VLDRLMDHDYPGNVRELENIIEQAFVLCRGEMIEPQHLPIELRPSATKSPFSDAAMSMRSAQEHLIELALERNQGNRQLTARQLGINPSTLYRRLKALGLPTPPQDGRGKQR
jgi:DNA-binding NtrC family response regulator